MDDTEKLEAFYLGKTVDPDASRILDELLLYDAKDLMTIRRLSRAVSNSNSPCTRAVKSTVPVRRLPGRWK